MATDKNQRIQGRLGLGLGATILTSFQVQDVRWTPDGDKISFVYQGSLWTLPVE